MAIDHNILLRPLQQLDTTPLMQLAAQKEQRRMQDIQLKRQEKIDAMNEVTTTLQQKKLMMEVDAMGAEKPDMLQEYIGGATGMLINMEVLAGLAEAGAEDRPEIMGNIRASYEQARAAVQGKPTLEQGIDSMWEMFETGNFDGAEQRLATITAHLGAAKPVLEGVQSYKSLQAALGGQQEVTGKLGTPRHFIDKESGDLVAFFDTEQGTVDAQRNPIQVPTDVPIVSGVTLGATEAGGLPKSLSATMRNDMAGVASLNATIAEAIDMVDQTPDINAWAGSMASLANDIRVNASSLLNRVGKDIEGGLSQDELLNPSTYDDTWRELGVENEQFKSIVTGLAFKAALASGQSGRSVSDRDVQRFIQRVGGSTSDPIAIKNNLRQLARETTRDFELRAAAQDFDFDFDLGFGEIESRFSRNKPTSGMSDEQFNQLLEVLTR